MKKTTLMMALLLPVLLRGASSKAASMSYRFNENTGSRQITFYSRTALEGFEGVANQFAGSAQVDYSKPNLDLHGTFTVPVKFMSTGMAMRDEHMRSQDWLNEAGFPTIQFNLGDPRMQKVRKKKKDVWFITAVGNFSIKGRTKEVEAPLTVERKKTKKGELLIIKGSFQLRLNDFDIHGPYAMKMIGAKVSPDIKVSLRLEGQMVGSINGKGSW